MIRTAVSNPLLRAVHERRVDLDAAGEREGGDAGEEERDRPGREELERRFQHGSTGPARPQGRRQARGGRGFAVTIAAVAPQSEARSVAP